MEDQVRVVSNEIFREYNKAVGRHASHVYKINAEKRQRCLMEIRVISGTIESVSILKWWKI